jgi:hypothetical protein
MKIVRAFGLFFAVLVTVLGVCAAGCGSSSSNEPGASALGESCTRTADCQSGLVCLANACFRMAGPVDGGGAEGGGEAGVTPAGPHLSQIGETCQATMDCASGLDCVPSSGGASVCDIVSYGLTASSKTCSGECSNAMDCCELPVGISLNGTNDAGQFTFVNVHNCQDILQQVLGGDASVCALPPSQGSATTTGCFYYQTYCACAPNTWACTANRCVYTAACQNSFRDTLTGCPSLTRTRSALSTFCDSPGNRCHSTSGGCSMDADCEGTTVADVPGATCRGGDCTCAASACYLKCAKDLDCQAGYSCDATKKVCVPFTCTNDGQCFSQLGKARAKCNGGTCAIACTNDHDCSPSGDIVGQPFNGTVCGSNGFCAPVGCASDADCGGSTSAHLFCVTPVTTNVHSAITN